MLAIRRLFGLRVNVKYTRHTVVFLLIGLVESLNAATWTRPLGIPDVPAGMDPEQASPAQPGGWPGTPVSGYYYVDNSHPSATDTDNALGTPNTPRVTLPGSVSFSRIEIVGGGTNYVFTSRTWTATGGSQETKAAIIGINEPVLASSSSALKIAGEWVLVENMILDNTTMNGNSVDLDHCLVRRNVIRNWTGSSTGSMISLGYRGTGQTAYNEFNVVYANVVTNIGDLESESESDCLGVSAGDGNRNLWVVDNEIDHVAGDSIRTGTNVGGGHEPNRAENIFIGRNHFHSNLENAIDVKNSVRTLITENDVHDFVPSAGSGGTAIAIHEQAVDTAVVFNRIHSCYVGLSPTSGGQSNVIAGWNAFYNITSGGDPDVLDTAGTAINWSALVGVSATVGNTFADNDRDINIEVSSGTASFVIANNLFLGTKSTGAHIGFENGFASINSPNAFFNNNLFATNTTSAVLQHGSTQYEDLASADSAFPVFTDCLEGDPGVVNAGTRDYSLTEDSDAIGEGVEESVLATLTEWFGTSFAFDISGTARPQGAWDIGAYEFVADEPAVPVRQFFPFLLR